MGETLTAIAGTDRAWQLQANKSDGTPVDTLLDTDALSAVVWPGDDLAALFRPACAWVSAPAGTYTVTVAAADTAALVPGTYRLQVTVGRSGKTVNLFDGSLQLTEAPGTAAARPTYCDYEDMLVYAPFLERLQTDRDQAGFARQRARARTHLDQVILRHARPGGYWGLSQGPLSLLTWGVRRSPVTNRWVEDQLGAGLLLVTDQVREIAAKLAIHYVLAIQVGPDGSNPYQALATRFQAEAQALIAGCTAELDLDGDGRGEMAFDLGACDTMWA